MIDANAYELLEGPVLIVDDEPDVVEIISEIVSSLGVTKILTASNPVEALDRLSGQRPALVISDHRMPQMSGVEFCARLRERFVPAVPFFLVTGFADKGIAIESINQGVSKIFEKPVEMEKFTGELRAQLDVLVAKVRQELEEIEAILREFVVEASEIIEEYPSLVVQLESRSGDPVLVDLLFRKVHTLKGGAGAIPNGEYLSRVAHSVENVFSGVRSKKFKVTESLTDLFLAAGDLFKIALDAIEAKVALDEKSAERCNSLMTALDQVVQTGASGDVSVAVAGGPGVPKVEARADEKDKGVLVTSEKLDEFMNLSGELIVLKNAIRGLQEESHAGKGAPTEQRKLTGFSLKLNKITDHFQELILEVRKVELSESLKGLPRLVRQLSKSCGKSVNLVEEGLDLRVDKNVARAMQTCLIHMVRNSIDHGLETQSERLKHGKSATGTVLVSAKQVEGNIVLQIKDDGAGIDPQKVSSKAVEKGLVSAGQAEKMTKSEIFDLLFLPGFSTAQKVSEVSGRGVGMDAVKTEILKLSGRILITSEIGKGAEISMEIPVPRSVMVENSIIAETHGLQIAVPQKFVDQILDMKAKKVVDFGTRLAILFEDRGLPLFDYKDGVCSETILTADDLLTKSVLVMSYKRNRLGLVVDRIHGQLEAVVTPFNGFLGKMPGFKGTTLLSDDRIAYVVAPEEFIADFMDAA